MNTPTNAHVSILGICGSLQANSKNLALLQTAAASAPAGTSLVIFDGIRDLPHFNPDIGPADSVRRWQQALTHSDALLIATPEYAFSLPGTLKNAIDWVIGSGELEGKVVATTTAVARPERGRRGLQALREPLSAVRASIVGGEPIVSGPDFDRDVHALLLAIVAAVRAARGDLEGIDPTK